MSDKPIQILLVEDNPLDVHLVQEMLTVTGSTPFAIEHTTRLSAGLERLAAGGIDVVLLDLTLPDSRGLETFVKMYARVPQVPIVVLSALEDEALAVKAVEEGAQDYMVKGRVDGGLLMRAIRYAIERKRGEESLRASEAQYRSLFDGVPVGLYRSTPSGQYLDANTALVEMMGYPDRESLLAVDVIDVYANARDRRRWQEMMEQDGVVRDFEVQELRRDGTTIWVRNSARAVRDDRGQVLYYEGAIEDITERKQAEEALQQYAKQLRALAARLAEAEEAERQRIARELHDQVGQNLTALGINLNIARSQVPEEVDAAQARLDDSLALVEETTERIRGVMADLRPPVLDDYGLVAALRWYGEQFTSRSGIPVAVQGEELAPRLAARAENALFRIAQEALTNVTKHAQATQVTVTVDAAGETVRLVITDDGTGFDPTYLAESGTRPAWGLLTITERAEAVGGRCRVESRPGQGTQVIAEVAR